MPNPLSHFVAEGRRLIEISRPADPIPDQQLLEFTVNEKHLEFLGDLIARAAVVAYCYDAICNLTERYHDRQTRIRALPTDPQRSNLRWIPKEYVDEEERWLVEVDVFTSLIYYEVTSIAGMLRQLGVPIDTAPEVQFLVKVRDRFLSHIQRFRISRGSRGNLDIPESGFLHLHLTAPKSWTAEDIKALDTRALAIGSPEWEEQRVRRVVGD